MSTQLVNISHALKVAVSHGASSSYTPFKQALFADKAIKRTIVAEAQGPRLTVYKLPLAIAEEFGKRYANEHPKMRHHTPITQAAPVHPDQLQLDLVEPDDTPPVEDDRIDILTKHVERLGQLLHSMDTKLVRLLMMWEGDDK